MIPKTLTLKGLYSYQEQQQIDFSHLLEGQLFGIFGSVGSGKSTILEAITFALYGETDRLNNRDNRNYNMMNLKSDELWIDYTFINYENDEYRYTVQAKRNSKDFSNVRTYQRNAYKRVNNDWVPVDVTLTPEITGLTYQNFKRTIIIPQGKFQEFLQLSDKERTTMMKELFNLDKYEFYGQTAALESRTKEKLSNLQGRLSHYEQVNKEVINEKRKAGDEVKKQLQQHIAIRRKAEEKVQKLEKLRELFSDLQEKQKIYNQLQLQKDEFQLRKKALEEYERVQHEFGNLLSRRQELKEESATYEQQEKEINAQIRSGEKESEKLEVDFSKVEQEYQQIDTRKEKLNDLKEWDKVLEANEAIQKFTERIADGEAKIRKVKDEASRFEGKKKELEKRIAEIKEDMPDQQELMQVRDWYNKMHAIEEKRKDKKQELKTINQKESQNSSRLVEGLPDTFKNEIPAGIPEDAKKLIEWIQHKHELLAKNRDELVEKLDQYNLQSKLEAYADELHEGEPCPLCGSETHPKVLDARDVSEHKKEFEKEKEKFERRMEQHIEAVNHCKLIQSLNKDLADQRTMVKEKLQQLEDQASEHQRLFKWKTYRPDNEQQVSEHIAKLKRGSDQLKALEEKHQASENNFREMEKRANDYEKLLTDIRNQKIAAETTRKDATERLRQLQPDQMPADKNLLAQETASLRKLVEKSGQVYKELEKKRHSLRDELLKLKTRHGQIQEHLDKLKQRLEQLNEELQEKLKRSGYNQLEEAEEIMARNINVREERSKIERFFQDYFTADKNLQEVSLKAKGHTFDKEEYEKEKQELNQIIEKEDVIKGKKVTLEHELNQLKEALKEKELVMGELEALQKRDENLRTMKQLFKGSGFVNYVSSVYLQNLCDAANERFYRLTRQQLQLEIDENNNFRVRDFLNNGRTRSVKTLSGGQTFQASLSLALALAGSVQQQAKSNQNFFFLDEGFGTLDRESLQTVFDTLKSLRHENRIVGVISHVEEMQQEIDMFVKVSKDQERGSLIKGSWE